MRTIRWNVQSWVCCSHSLLIRLIQTPTEAALDSWSF